MMERVIIDLQERENYLQDRINKIAQVIFFYDFSSHLKQFIECKHVFTVTH